MALHCLSLNINDALKYFQEIVRGRLSQVVYLYFMQSPRHVYCFYCQSFVYFVVGFYFEKCFYFGSLQSGGGNENLQGVGCVEPLGDNFLQETKEDFGINRFLVDVIQHDDRILRKEWVLIQLLNHHSISHEYYPRILVNSGVEPDMMCDLMIIDTQLFRHPPGNGHSCYSPWDADAYFFITQRVPSLDEILGDFGCLA